MNTPVERRIRKREHKYSQPFVIAAIRNRGVRALPTTVGGSWNE
jgi:hypothetical protein